MKYANRWLLCSRDFELPSPLFFCCTQAGSRIVFQESQCNHLLFPKMPRRMITRSPSILFQVALFCQWAASHNPVIIIFSTPVPFWCVVFPCQCWIDIFINLSTDSQIVRRANSRFILFNSFRSTSVAGDLLLKKSLLSQKKLLDG